MPSNENKYSNLPSIFSHGQHFNKSFPKPLSSKFLNNDFAVGNYARSIVEQPKCLGPKLLVSPPVFPKNRAVIPVLVACLRQLRDSQTENPNITQFLWQARIFFDTTQCKGSPASPPLRGYSVLFWGTLTYSLCSDFHY